MNHHLLECGAASSLTTWPCTLRNVFKEIDCETSFKSDINIKTDIGMWCSASFLATCACTTKQHDTLIVKNYSSQTLKSRPTSDVNRWFLGNFQNVFRGLPWVDRRNGQQDPGSCLVWMRYRDQRLLQSANICCRGRDEYCSCGRSYLHIGIDQTSINYTVYRNHVLMLNKLFLSLKLS